MENKDIRLRRIIYFVCVILSLIFLTFYGGNVPYMVFFLLAGNFLFSFGYIIYVYYYIRITQNISQHGILKGEYSEFDFSMANEGILPISNVRLNFKEECSSITGTKELKHIGLDTKECIKYNLSLCCDYSGTYSVGVDTLEIMDYFGVFRLKFPMPQKTMVLVKPRILDVHRLKFLPDIDETVNSSNMAMSEQVPDNQTRYYESGDDSNHIHWRNSAKNNRLMVRTMTSEETNVYYVYLDCDVKEGNYVERIKKEDKLREAYVGIVNYLNLQGYDVVCAIGGNEYHHIMDRRGFFEIYETVSRLNFLKARDTSGKAQKKFEMIRAKSQYEVNSTLMVISAKGNEKDEKDVVWVDVSAYSRIEELFCI